MKNITFRADERDIEAAEERARSERTTLSEESCRWLAEHGQRERRCEEVESAMDRVSGKLRVGRKLTSDEMNDR